MDCQLVIVPENFALGGLNPSRTLEIAQQERSGGPQPLQNFLKQQARQHGLWIVGGTIPLFPDSGDQQKPFTTTLVIDADGNEVARYNKIHLFDADVADSNGQYRESDNFSAGDGVVVVDTPVGKLGLAICYDLRFSELFFALRQQGAEVIAVPSAFTAVTGEAHWEILLRARAIETQCYVAGAGMGDREHPKRPNWGGSAIVDGWGVVLAGLEGGDGLITAEIDLQRLHQQRQQMPVMQHRRL